MNRFIAIVCGLLLALPTLAAPALVPVEGTDYVTIDGGQPYAPLRGKVEVVEVFGYWCPHCAEFEPSLSAWTRKQPSDVRFTTVPAVFTAGDVLARAYFAAQQFGVLRNVHEAIFQAIHADGTLPRDPTVDEMATWFSQHGVDAARAKAAMLSPAVEAKLTYAREFAIRSGVEGTPTLVINGRYRITARTHEEGLQIASALIQSLRAKHPLPPHS